MRKIYSIKELDLGARLQKHGILKFQKKKALSKLQYIIHLLLRYIIYKRASREDFFCLNSKALEEVIGSRYVKPAKNALIKIGVIEAKTNKKGKESYKVGKESKKYRICQEFWESKFEMIEIHSSFIKREQKIEEKRIRERNKDRPWLKLLNESQKRISFDFEGALEYCKNELSEKNLLSALHGEMTINEIRNEIFRGVLDSNGRYYHNYSSLNRQLRRFASFDGKKLKKIDVTSSHFCLMTHLYEEECPEKQTFISVLKEGRFYDVINAALDHAFDLSDDEERGIFKGEFFQFALFSPEETGKKEVAKKEQKEKYRAAFSQVFPILALEVERLRKKKGHKFLPNKLMQIEAEIIIDNVVRRLHEALLDQEAIVLSLHDCIVTETRLTSVVSELITEEYRKVVGFNPHLKTDLF